MATKTKAVAAQAAAESVYTAEELAAKAELFHTRPEVVIAALGRKTKITEKEAAAKIAAFLKKEVK